MSRPVAQIFDGENAEVSHIDIHQVEKELHAGEHTGPIDEKTGIQTQHTPV
jgi:hypothetical protein